MFHFLSKTPHLQWMYEIRKASYRLHTNLICFELRRETSVNRRDILLHLSQVVKMSNYWNIKPIKNNSMSVVLECNLRRIHGLQHKSVIWINRYSMKWFWSKAIVLEYSSFTSLTCNKPLLQKVNIRMKHSPDRIIS